MIGKLQHFFLRNSLATKVAILNAFWESVFYELWDFSERKM